MINRREFLKILVSAGASIALPFDLSAATATEVDRHWTDISRSPIRFDVQDGTIYAPWGDLPHTFGDIHDLTSDFTERSELVAAYDSNFDLQSHFYYAFEDVASVEDSLAAQLCDKLDMDEGVAAWLQTAPLEDLNQVVESWLAAELPINYEMPLESGPIGEAYGYFLRQDATLLRLINIVVIEGEHPGSSYFAAELRMPVIEANMAAEALDIPIRFREVV